MSHLFYEPHSWYMANQRGSAKETVIPNIGEIIETLVCFICVGTQDRILILILYQSSLSNYNESTKKLNMKIEYKYIYKSNIFTVSAAYLFKLLCHISFQIKRLQKKKFLQAGSLWQFFISPGQWIGNEQVKIQNSLTQCCYKTPHEGQQVGRPQNT